MKRNIVKRTVIKNNEREKKIKFKKSCLGKYQFPIETNVPPGLYISKIEAICQSCTKRGEQSYDVCYRIASLSACYRKANGILSQGEEVNYYFIKQRYVYGSDYDAMFIEAMHNTGIVDDEFDADDVIGITEKISLIYKSDGGLGSIDKRCPITRKDLKEEYQERLALYSQSEELID